jgi:hypothetical protein
MEKVFEAAQDFAQDLVKTMEKLELSEQDREALENLFE